MGLLLICDLRLILDRLLQSRGVHAVNNLILPLHLAVQRIIDPAGLQKHLLPGELSRRLIDGIVGPDGHADALQILAHGLPRAGSSPKIYRPAGSSLRIRCPAGNRIRRMLQNLRIDKEIQLLHRHHHIGQGNRVKADIVSPDIEQPANIVQRGQKMSRSVKLSHLSPEECDLIKRAAAAEFLIQHPGRPGRQGRTVFPDAADQILIAHNGHPLVLQPLLQLLPGSGIHHPAVKSQAAPLRQNLLQIFLRGRHTGMPHLHHLHLGARNLSGSLDKIPSVHPQPRLIHGDHRDARRSRKPGDKLPALKMLPHIFRFMKIRRRHQIGVHPRLPHQRPQALNSSIHIHISSASCKIFFVTIQTGSWDIASAIADPIPSLYVGWARMANDISSAVSPLAIAVAISPIISVALGHIIWAPTMVLE